ncbi:MAG TPA: amidase family protein [Bacilli bacterium]|nr:amidase family protein [Bacilli bacterium]
MYRKMMIDELRSKLDNNEVTGEELFNEAHDLANKYQEKYNSFVTIIDKYQFNGLSDSLITNIPYALKDNYSTKGILTTASSNILKNYIPVYDSTVYKKLKEAGAILVGKTVLDELAMGGTGTTGHTGKVKNPWDEKRMIGGSSAGSAAAVALGIVPFAIGSDTGDSVRKPAHYGGVVGFKPSYGRISRYGLFAFASSLDHVGIFARSVKDIAIVTDILKGYDENDMTSLPDEDIKYTEKLDLNIQGKKLFYLKNICDIAYYDNPSNNLKEILNNFQETITNCQKLGIEVYEEEIDIDLLNAIYPVYNILSCAEATSNNSNLTGIPFGVRGEGSNINDIMFNARTKGFSELIKRRFVIGSYVLRKENQEKLYLNACRIRRMLVDKFNTLFTKYDGFIMPAGDTVAPKFDERNDNLSKEYLVLGNFMVIGNFGGYPSITIPSGFVNNLPVGVNITGAFKNDDLVLNIANELEEIMNYKGMIAGEDDV